MIHEDHLGENPGSSTCKLVTSDKPPNFSGPRFSDLSYGIDDTPPGRLLQRSGELIRKCSGGCPEPRKHWKEEPGPMAGNSPDLMTPDCIFSHKVEQAHTHARWCDIHTFNMCVYIKIENYTSSLLNASQVGIVKATTRVSQSLLC